MVTIKRIYDRAIPSDGYRILVDRLWPRGISKEEAKIDLWLKDIAPSDELRTWFGHDPARWEEFKKRYEKELASHQTETDLVRQKSSDGRVTLLFAAKDEAQNNAVVIRSHLAKRPIFHFNNPIRFPRYFLLM